MIHLSNIFGKAIYTLVFLVVIPFVLWVWAEKTEHIVTYPAYRSIEGGWTLVIFGLLFMTWGMYALIKYGKGLPMNAYPPQKLVSQGPFRLSRNPVYWGFGFLVVGYFIAVGSASGLWLVTPIVILSMLSLVVGYEIIDLSKRFPGQSFKTIFDFPVRNQESPGTKERVIVLLWLVPFMLLSNGIIFYLVGNIDPYIGFPLSWNLIHSYPISQITPLAFIVVFPFLIKTNALLRDWLISTLLALIFTVYLALLWPVIGAQYLSHGNWSTIAVPLSFMLISYYTYYRQSQRFPLTIGSLVILLILIQLSFSKSALLHTVTALFVFFLSAYYYSIWTLLKNSSEYIANSWKEWIIGKVRIINHGFYVGFASFVGILLASVLAGEGYAWTTLLYAVIVIVFSALWAQIIEGSEKLKRPFGFYGAMVGIVFASIAVWALDKNVWVTIGAITVVMPWVQAIGRLRCLINGCCHGAVMHNENIGIRYHHHRSRVCGISGLKGEYLHPTPLYSILWLIVVGFVLLTLWNNGFTPVFIFGIYLILTGIGRFVEEGYRGEEQTPILKGLRLYQWIAILTLFLGIFITTFQIEIPFTSPSLSGDMVGAAIAGGVFTFFAMGVDFPHSNARFSRLV